MDRTTRLRDLDKRVLWHPFTPQQRWTSGEPLVIERASGCTLYDTDGNAYLDGVSSLWTTVHGHGHPRIDEAIRDQLDRLDHSTLLGLTHPPAIHLAERLVGLAPWGLTRVFFSDSGSTATEVAVKMAFQAQQNRGQSGRTKFACLTDAYHGDTLGAVSVGGIPVFHQIFEPLLFGAVALPAPRDPGGEEEQRCLHTALSLLDVHAHELAALIVEPLVQGAAGMKMHTVDYLRPLLERARERGVLVIADEVAVGMGRTGSMLAMNQVGFAPDFLCLAKGLSGGVLPIAATLAAEEVYEAFLGAPEENRQFFHGHTFTGNPLACAAALASLDLFDEEDVLARVRERSAQIGVLLEQQIRPLRHVARIRQCGVMVGIDLEAPEGEDALPAQTGHLVCMASRRHGVILRPLGNTIVLNPPLAIGVSEVTHLVRAARDAIVDVLGGAP